MVGNNQQGVIIGISSESKELPLDKRLEEVWRNAYAAGFAVGEVDGLIDGREQGFAAGYDENFAEGHAVGFTDGYKWGFSQGRLLGYGTGLRKGRYGDSMQERQKIICWGTKKVWRREKRKDSRMGEILAKEKVSIIALISVMRRDLQMKLLGLLQKSMKKAWQKGVNRSLIAS